MPATLIRSVTDTLTAATADAVRTPARRRTTKPGEEVEVGVGGDLDPSPSRRLTVTQLQQALRIAYAATADAAPTVHPHGAAYCVTGHDSPLPSLPCDGAWLTVVPAHAGAGASIVALALADAFADAQNDAGHVHLIGCADPASCGLAAATEIELGIDATGAWQVGRRGMVTLHRRAVVAQRGNAWVWPDMLRSSGDGSPKQVVIVDLSGIGAVGEPGNGLVREAPVTVLVAHTSVPGMQAVDRIVGRWQALPSVDASDRGAVFEHRVIMVAVGPRRWPGAVTASLSPRLARLRRSGRVVPVPVDARLWVTGASSAPLPPRVRAAARTVLTLLPPGFRDVGAVVSPTRADDSASRVGERDYGGLDALLDVLAEDRR